MFVGDPGSAGQFASNYFAAGERDNLTKQSQVRLQALVLWYRVSLFAELNPKQPRYLSRIAQRPLRKQVTPRPGRSCSSCPR